MREGVVQYVDVIVPGVQGGCGVGGHGHVYTKGEGGGGEGGY